MGLDRIQAAFQRIGQIFPRRKTNEGSRSLSFRILYLCIFLPPVLYIFTIQGLERHLDNTWSRELSTELITDMPRVATGRISLQEEIRKNVNDFITGKKLTRLGVIIHVGVRTDEGRQLYPVFDLDRELTVNRGGADENHLSELERSLTARESIGILREGLVLNLSVQIPHNTWVSNIILIFYIFTFSLLLYRSYQAREIKSRIAAEEQKQKLENTRNRLDKAQSSLREFSGKEEAYTREMETLKRDLEKADNRLKITEEEALKELEDLEQKLSSVTAQRENQELEILQLSEHLEKLHSDRQARDKKKQKLFDQQLKRFSTLYKRLKFHDRAVQGFMELPEELQLKAEELIHTLNEDLQKVSVKRKVFSRGTTTSFETDFAYRGRLYWSRNSGGKVEVLAVGTKNTQSKDLKYLEGID